MLLLPPVLLFIAIGVHTLLGGATIAYAWSGFIAALVLNGFGAGLGEELGWRGFALPRMLARQQAISVSFILFVVMITAYAVLFTWVYNNTKGSLLLMVLFHAAVTTTGVMFLAPQRDVIVYILYVILLWVVVTIVVVRAGAARLSRSSTLAPA